MTWKTKQKTLHRTWLISEKDLTQKSESDMQQPYFFEDENKKQQVLVHCIIAFPQLCLVEKWHLCELHSWVMLKVIEVPQLQISKSV